MVAAARKGAPLLLLLNRASERATAARLDEGLLSLCLPILLFYVGSL
jgi:hypothetical protein